MTHLQTFIYLGRTEQNSNFHPHIKAMRYFAMSKHATTRKVSTLLNKV